MKNKLLFFAIFCLFIFSQRINGQTVSIFDDGSSTSSSAVLDVQSTTRGLLIPRLTTTQRMDISSPATGLLVFDSDTKSFWFRNSAAWVELVDGNVQTMADDDADTQIQVEENADEDKIRFDVAGTELMVLDDKTLHLEAPGDCVFIGKDAGMNDDGTSNQNTFIGYRTGVQNTSGAGNTMMGYLAGSGNSTGIHNTFMGWASGQNNSGSSNTFLGMWSGFVNTSGSDNTFLGKEAGKANQIGNNNTLLGRAAGRQIKGSGNICLGYEAGKNFVGSNRLYIDNSDTSTPLIWGDLAADKLKVYGLLGIGDEYTFPAIDGQEGHVLTTDGFGQVSWSNSPIIKKLSDMDFDTKIQVEESADDDIIRFDVKNVEVAAFDGKRMSMPMVHIGTGAGEGSTQTTNVFMGPDAGSNVNNGANVGIGQDAMNPVGSVSATELVANVAVGFGAMGNAATESTAVGYQAMGNGAGEFNTGIGAYALKSGGYFSTAVGHRAMEFNSGWYGTAIGAGALYTNEGHHNTAIGQKALESNDTGAQNTAIGSNALSNNSLGNNNVAIGISTLANASAININNNTAVGSSSLISNSQGDNNTALGYLTNVTSSNLSNATVIGANATVGCSNCLVLDTDADVGIRTSTPDADLHLNHQNGGSSGYGFRLENQSNGNYFRFYTSSSPGDLWIYSDDSPSTVIASMDPVSGIWTALSDATRKKNIEPLTEVLPEVLRLQPGQYHFIGENPSKPKHLGFLAQEVKEVFPSLVKHNEESETYTMNYSGFGVVAVAAIQEQQVIIEEMRKHILLLEERLEQLEE